jgi:hypothetical protein
MDILSLKNILTAIGFLARRRENEATGVYITYMRIEN